MVLLNLGYIEFKVSHLVRVVRDDSVADEDYKRRTLTKAQAKIRVADH